MLGSGSKRRAGSIQARGARQYLALALLAGLALPGTARPQQAASIAAPDLASVSRQAFAGHLQRSLRDHPDVAARLLAFNAQNRAWGAAGAALRPRVDFSGQAGSERASTADGAGGSRQYAGANNRATLVMRQPVYDGAELSSEVERQARLGNARLFDLRQGEDNVMLEMSRAWVDVLRQRSLVQVSRESLANHERLQALVRSRVTSGLARGVDLDQALGRVASARLSLSSDEGALQEAITRFYRNSLVPPPAQMMRFDIAAQALPASELEAVTRAFDQAPQLQSARESAAAVAAEIKLRQSAFAPKVALEARHDLTARTALIPDAAASSLLVTVNYNLYAGGGDTLREQDATLRFEAARQQYRDALVATRQSASAAWAEVARQAGIHPSAVAYAESVSRARDLYQSQYDIGQRSLLDLLNTENEVAQARRLEINSWSDRMFAQLRLLSVTGRLAETFDVKRSDGVLLLQPAEIGVDPTPLLSAAQPAGDLAPVAVATQVIQAPRADAPVMINTVAAPQAEPRRSANQVIPAGLVLDLAGWRSALSSGGRTPITRWYEGPPPDLWTAAASPDASAQTPVRVVNVERIDGAEDGSPNSVQLAVLARIGARSDGKCVRSAQIWKPRDGGGWSIQRERVVMLPPTQCPAGRG